MGKKINDEKRLNYLDGKSWLRYSFSIWRDIRKTPEEIKLKHPAMFPIALTARIIEIFTKKGDVVLDPFMGCGSTVIASVLEGRKGIGLDLSKDYYEIAMRRLNNIDPEKLKEDRIEPEIYNGDARELGEHISESSIDLCITSPPYWDILNRSRTADKKQSVSYSDSDKDLGNISSYEYFLGELEHIFSLIHAALKPKGFCVVVVMDIRKKNKFYSFHSDLANRMIKNGYSFEDIIIWDRQHEYNNMRPLGYPYAFRINKVHEYILIFRKGEKNG